MGRFSEVHQTYEIVSFKARGRNREDIAQSIKNTMSSLGASEYKIDTIHYQPTIVFVDGRVPEDWTAEVDAIVLERQRDPDGGIRRGGGRAER